jgi:hypothetical protein
VRVSELEDVAGELYSLAPEAFTAARDAAATSAGGDVRAQVKALRRPTVSAWLVNRLAREQPDLLDELLALGPALVEAQAARSGEDLRALGQQRRQLVQAVTSAAVDAAGRDVTATVRGEVEQTLEAALADPGAADAVRSGALVRPLAFAGFGGVDLSEAVAVERRARPAARTSPSAGAQPAASAHKPARRSAKAVERAEKAAQDAAGALDDAVRAAEQAERQHAATEQAARTAEQERAASQARVDELEGQLSAARRVLEQVGHRAHEARAAQEKARQAAQRALQRVQEAQAVAEQTRAELDALRRG